MIMIIDKDHLEGRGHVDDRPRLEQNHRRGGEGTHEQIWEKYFLNYFLQRSDTSWLQIKMNSASDEF